MKGWIIRERYNSTYKGYDELYRAEQYEKYTLALRRVKPQGSILDAGCGTGLLIEYLNATGYMDSITKYTCLDYSWKMLEIASWRSKLLCSDKCSVIGGNIESMPFTDKVFDISYAFTVLDLVDSIDSALRELKRVTRGTIVVSMLKTLPYKDVFIKRGYRVLAISSKDVIFSINAI